MKCSKCQKDAVISFDKYPLCEDHAEEDKLPVVSVLVTQVIDLKKEQRALVEENNRLREEIRKLTSETIHLNDQIPTLIDELSKANQDSAELLHTNKNLEQQLSDTRAERDRFDSDLEQCKESRQELERTSVSISTYKLLEARLEESHETIKLLAESLRGEQ